MSRYLARLQQQEAELRSTATAVLDTAATEDRDLTDGEQATINDLHEQLRSLGERIAPLAEAEMRQAASDRRAAELSLATAHGRPTGDGEPLTGPTAPSLYRSAGAWMADVLATDTDPVAGRRLEQALAQYRAVDPHLIATNPALVPEPIVGELIDTLTDMRPLVASLTSRPMPPKGSTFRRLYVKQRTLVGTQATEMTDLPGRVFQVDELTATKRTAGGVAVFSRQTMDWSDPDQIDLVINDLAIAWALDTEANAAADFLPAVTATSPYPTAGASWGEQREAIFTAAALVKAGVHAFPDTMWVSPDVWVRFGGETTANSDNPTGLMPVSWTGSPFGVPLVVCDEFPAKTAVLGVSRFAEHYEDRRGLISAPVVKNLSFELAVYGYDALLVTKPSAFVKLAFAV